jgi:hypothetical protein
VSVDTSLVAKTCDANAAAVGHSPHAVVIVLLKLGHSVVDDGMAAPHSDFAVAMPDAVAGSLLQYVA